MKVKHLIRELQKCDPEFEVIGPECTKTWAIEQQPADPWVIIFSHDPNPDAPDYDNASDTPQPWQPDHPDNQ